MLALVVGAIGVLLRPTGVGRRLEEEVGLPWLFARRGPVEPHAGRCDRQHRQKLCPAARAWTRGNGRRRATSTPASSAASIAHDVSAIVMDVWFEDSIARRQMTTTSRGRWPKTATSCSSSASIAPACSGADISTELLQSPVVEFQQSAIGLAPFPLPRSALTSFFWPFFETSAGTVATLPAAALQVHALPLLDRLLSLLEQAGVGNLRRAAAARGLVARLAAADAVAPG